MAPFLLQHIFLEFYFYCDVAAADAADAADAAVAADAADAADAAAAAVTVDAQLQLLLKL